MAPKTVAPLGKKVLIVDDDVVIRKTITAKLESQGYTVATAEDGSEAIQAARKERPDLILLDLGFPPDVAHGGAVGWDGFLVMNWLARLESARNIPVIVITGQDPASCKGRALAAGAADYFQKPIQSQDLLGAVKRHTIGEFAGSPKGAAASDFQI